MHIEFLVEEDSAEAALYQLVPKIIGSENSFDVHTHQGKLDLLQKLPERLRGYSHWLPDDWRIVVLIDEDRQDCLKLKAKLELIASEAGLVTRSNAPSSNKFQVVNRLAIEELEAWFFGDVEAVMAAYPRVQKGFEKKKAYRNPDNIGGGTSEALKRILQTAGYYPSLSRLPKIEVAQNIAAYMNPTNNTSRSFQVFKEALKTLITEAEN